MSNTKNIRIDASKLKRLLKILPGVGTKEAEIYTWQRNKGLVEVWVNSPDATERRENTLVISCMRLLDDSGDYELQIFSKRIDALPERFKLKVRAALAEIRIKE